MVFTRSYIIWILGLILLWGCGENVPKPINEKVYRTVLLYVAANNNLSSEAYNNIDQIVNNIGEVDGNLIVYAKLPSAKPALYHISKLGKKKIKEYSITQNSSDATVLRQIIEEVKQDYEAKSYGLILWSHATGWIPKNAGQIKLKSFGNDGGDEMDIKELNTALPSNLFDFILFDACSMASIEVLYEMKDKAKYFLASPGEVISNGMPYDKMINDLFSEGISAYLSIAQKYYQHYNSMSGNFQSATISVIDASQLQNIADFTKQILKTQTPLFADYNRDQLQRMDFDRLNNPLIAFDYLDFIETNYNAITTLKAGVDNAVLYKAHTPKFNGFAINKYSGLSCYVPHLDNEDRVHDYYRTLKWYTASGFDALF